MAVLLKSALLFLLACGAVIGAVHPSSPQAIKERGYLRVAVYDNEPPFGYVDGHGNYDGFDIRFAKRLAKELLGDENLIRYTVLINQEERVQMLLDDIVDVVFASFTVTSKRAKEVDFANPYMKTAIGVVSPEDAHITNLKQLRDKKLIVYSDTTADLFFRRNYPEIALLRYARHEEAFGALLEGRGAALAQDTTLLVAWAQKHKGFKVGMTMLGNAQLIAPAVKKGNDELREWINATFERMGEEQFALKTFNEILKPYYGDIGKEMIVEGGKP
ncbi:MAG: transporter substrate-binding domain-containing protein [Helicobacteraceae bacterium]|jgi:polar amino acid transport system substrate-binding protein|nr:transporter substrate-binding domain-containing protein [Helicobacteraceae bacterium]